MDVPATPALVVDRAVVERNLQRLSTYANGHELDLRPHAKTHKSKLFGAAQMAAGAVGLTVATVGEAEVMADVAGDLLLDSPAVDRARVERLATLARHVTMRVTADSTTAAEALAAAARRCSATIGILVDIDVGLGRTGVQTPGAALKMAQFIDRTAGIRLDGLSCYPGHIMGPATEQAAPLDAVADRLAEAIDLWARHGLEARIVSGGSTFTAFQSHRIADLTEIRPGSYLFNDIDTVRRGHCALDDCAARIVATVISTAVPGQFVLDAGSQSLGEGGAAPLPNACGYVCEYPHARISMLSLQQAQVDVRDCQSVPKLGDRVTIIPNRLSPCINLRDSLWLREPDGELVEVPIEARGRVV